MAQDDDAGGAPDVEAPDLEEAADELYGLHPDQFVPRRTELVKAARAAKDRETANAIGALRKPSLGAWLANVLARESPDEVAALEELGASLRTAQEELSGDALRTLTRQRRELVGALVARARRLARQDGVGVGDSVARDLENTIAAALADDGAARAFAAGRLTTALEPGVGFTGGVEPSRSGRRPPPRGGGTATRRPPPRRESPPEPEEDTGEEDERAAEEERRRAREAAERAVERAREERDDADRALERARSRAEQAGTDLEEADETVSGLRERLERAEADQERAREQHDAAKQAREEAETAADEARRALDQAEAERADLE
ncbi:MAG TPA: hypothetical protein VGH76_21740 [Actinomycetospora sp.]|uniref:hypothetical protein n=1 Tax=Actinomycetospora sp. TaxID=1872135 RepID=UPI002F3F53B2